METKELVSRNNPNLRNISIAIRVTITMIFITVFVFIIRNFRSKNDNFESKDVYIKDSIKCPKFGYCVSGRLYCIEGYERKGETCQKSAKTTQEEKELAKKIQIHIYKSLDENTCEGKRLTEDDLVKFKNDSNFKNAIGMVKNEAKQNGKRAYNITFDGEYLYSETPKLNLRCKALNFYDKNKDAIYLIIATIFLTLVLLGVFAYNNMVNEKVRRYSNNIIVKMSEKKRFGPTHYDSTEFQPIKTDPMMRYWNRIEKNIERNPNVCTLQTTHGKKWKLIRK